MQTGCVRINNMKKLTFFIMISLSLAGCTTQWVPATSSPTPFSEAKTTCYYSASRLFPVKNEVAQRTELRTVTHPCETKKGTCSYSIPTLESYVIDVNRDSRNNMYDSCMQQNGWKKKTKYLF
ncbi:hypothetical protein [Xenorhabdus beddingii]|uniref:hypothetical protein n=1 Tax=Xenorhabdus beddingii TaxID=40578 RepID=UPI001428B7E7|nr:hypothetical protein [Xenorhabdus beddingii]